jgi:hypothetical protein
LTLGNRQVWLYSNDHHVDERFEDGRIRSRPAKPFIGAGNRATMSQIRNERRLARLPVLGWLVLHAALAASTTRADGTAVAVAVPNSDEVARLCVAHGRYCDCPGCRAFYDACEIPCPPMAPAVVPGEGEQEGVPETAAPETETTQTGQPDSMTGPMPSVSSSLGAVAVATSAAPSMIGDFFGGGYQYQIASPVNGAAVAVAGGDRVLKFADNNSPLPQDRLFFNYHLFADPVLDVNGDSQDVNRFTFGLEKTLWDGTASVEFRVPFEASVSSTQTIGQAGDTTGAEFGNLALAVKMLLFERGPWAVGGGLGIIFPTADDAVIFNNDSFGQRVEAVRFANESFFLQPFLGVYYRPNSFLFTQFVTQVNFDVSGSILTVNDPTLFGGTGSDRLFEQSLLFLDYSVGYWAYRTKRCDVWLTGVAPIVELHYTTTMEDLDLPEIDSGPVFEEDFRRDALNITGGVIFEIGPMTSLRVAGVAPLRDDGLTFDSEFGLQLIRRY